MPFHKVTATGADPPILEGEQLVCKPCGTAYDSDATEQLWDAKRKKARCPNCGEFGKFIKRKAQKSKAVANRWSPGVAAVGWTPVPELLIKHQGLLQLNASDLVVLLNLEMHRRRADDKVWPSVPTIAKRSGLSVRTVRIRLGELSRRGLLEAEYGWRPDGGMSSKRSTAFGLRRALDLIADNVREGREAGEGLEELLVELRASASNNGIGNKLSPPAESARGKRGYPGRKRRGSRQNMPPK